MAGECKPGQSGRIQQSKEESNWTQVIWGDDRGRQKKLLCFYKEGASYQASMSSVSRGRCKGEQCGFSGRERRLGCGSLLWTQPTGASGGLDSEKKEKY
jgi:hypothetical protein